MSKTKTRCLVDAAAWQIHLADNDLKSSPEFEAWLEGDPQNRTAWDQVQKSWEFVGQHAASPELLELRHRALADARDTTRLRWTLMTKDSARKRTVRFALATAAAAAIVGIVAWFINSDDVYRTATGERRVVALADGSQVQLDSSTELRVRYAAHSRELALLRGQARFDVAHDIERPFVVAAGGRKVVATGTAFNVDLLGGSMVVTMIEGRVVVLAGATTQLREVIEQFAHSRTDGKTTASSQQVSSLRTDPGVELGVGQELVVLSSGDPRIVEANVERTISWQTGQLVFDNEILSSVIERMNRYSTKPLEIDDDSTRQLRISGVFSESDVPGFVETLTHYLPLRADVREHVIHLSHR